jgi:thymidylate kinase
MKFVVVTGADACGKDTQIGSLLQHCAEEGRHVQALTIWDSLQDFTHINDKKTLMDVLDTFLMKFEPHARSLFLLSCLKNSLDKIKPQTEMVIFNGYFHKYWASEMSYGVDPGFWENSLKGLLPVPEKIFYLRTPVDQCLGRRLKWSQYEQGAARSLHKVALNFREFQTEIHKNLDKILLGQKGVETLDGSLPVEEVFSQLVNRL